MDEKIQRKQKLSQSIRTKIIVLYFVMTIINITILTIIISDNQVDLISKNSRFEAKEMFSGVSRYLKEYNVGFNNAGNTSISNSQRPEAEQISLIQKMASSQLKNFVISDEQGAIIYQSDKAINIPEKFKQNIQKSITIGEFSGAVYYLEVNPQNDSIDFYFPLYQAGFQNKVLYSNYDLTKERNKYRDLLLSIFIMIIMVVSLHLIVAVYLYRLIIGPILKLREGTAKISSGLYETRVPSKQNDEIGQLGVDFNNMAGEIAHTIKQLEEKNTVISNELKLARKVQESMIPADEDFDSERSIKVAGKYLAMEDLGGDIYDVIKISDDKYGFLIADVSGHGVSASLFTVIAKVSFNSKALTQETAADVCEKVNQEITRLMGEMGQHYLTVFFGILDVRDGSFEYSCCGHHPAILLRREDESIEELGVGGSIVGMMHDFTFEMGRTNIKKGDKLVLFTDGIVEAMNQKKEMFTTERLMNIAKAHNHKNPKEFVDFVIEDVNKFCNFSDPRDDQTILCIEFNPQKALLSPDLIDIPVLTESKPELVQVTPERADQPKKSGLRTYIKTHFINDKKS